MELAERADAFQAMVAMRDGTRLNTFVFLPLTRYPDFATWQPFLDKIIPHPGPDAFRARHNFRHAIDIPGLHVTTWFDIVQTNVLAAFNDIQARTGTQKLWIGPNEHHFVYASNFFEWFDHHGRAGSILLAARLD
jgi:predicted acyl esterase